MKKLLILFPILTILYAILLISGMLIGAQLFPSELLSSDSNDGSLVQLLFISALNAGIIMVYIYNSSQSKVKLIGSLSIILFGLQYFMAQIESLWFNSALQMEENTIYAILAGGAITSVLLAMLSVTIFRRIIKRKHESDAYINNIRVNVDSAWFVKTLVLIFVIWPAIYFVAGYYIAWQFEAIRLFYSGSANMDSFGKMMEMNFREHLYTFQILRGLFWVLLGTLILNTSAGSLRFKALLTGALFMILSSSQLLMDNPIMPEAVRLGHLLETSTSNFIWGVILAYTYIQWIPKNSMLQDIRNKGYKKQHLLNKPAE